MERPPEDADERDEIDEIGPTHALLVAVDRDRLDDAHMVARSSGSVGVAVHRTDDLTAVAVGTPVLVYAYERGRRVSAVTWRAVFAGIEDHASPGAVELPDDPPATTDAAHIGDVADPDPDEEDATVVVYVSLRDLEPLPPREHIATNELVPKQERGARFFMPRDPRLVRLPP